MLTSFPTSSAVRPTGAGVESAYFLCPSVRPQRLSGFLAEIGRDRDLYGDQQITDRVAAARHPASAQPERSPRLGSRRDLQTDPTIEVWYGQHGTQGQFGERHGNGDGEIIAAAGEHWVRFDAHSDIQVPRRRPTETRFALRR